MTPSKSQVGELVDGLECCLDGWEEVVDRRGSHLHFKPPAVGPGSYQHIEIVTEKAATALRAQEAELEELRALLGDAADTVESWGAYADPYFQEKHDLAGDIGRFRKASQAERAEAALSGGGKA